jgi:hypothetical protein
MKNQSDKKRTQILINNHISIGNIYFIYLLFLLKVIFERGVKRFLLTFCIVPLYLFLECSLDFLYSSIIFIFRVII